MRSKVMDVYSLKVISRGSIPAIIPHTESLRIMPTRAALVGVSPMCLIASEEFPE
jgi:hypothetical protein